MMATAMAPGALEGMHYKATYTAMEQTLRARIQHYWSLHIYENATFLAERLVAHCRSEENVLTLATCFFYRGMHARAIAVLDGATLPAARYLLAMCCYRENRLVEAENALLGVENGCLAHDNATDRLPHGAAGLLLLGQICRRAHRRQQAIDCFIKALEQDATLWSAYEALCELGANADAARFFGPSTCFSDDGVSSEEDDPEEDSNSNQDDDEKFWTPQPRSLQTRTPQAMVTPHTRASRIPQPKFSSTMTSPLAYRTPNIASTTTSSPGFGSPQEVVKKSRHGTPHGPPNLRVRKTYRRPLSDTDEMQRRNTRLSFSSAADDSPAMGAAKTESTTTPFATRLFQSNPSATTSATASAPSKRERSTNAGNQRLQRLLSSFGAIYQRMSSFMCREALDMIERLPPAQLSSAWAQHQMGRAFFELADYKKAYDVFRAMHLAAPYRMEGLDLYSTTLWHLKKDVELSILAQEVTSFDKRSPEAWCVAGNCFSLQKEHETALSFFQRAIQLDPFFAYAYTLSGHEYVSNEDFDKAIKCYRLAIRVDPRHYNAWYGLGTIYHRQEKYGFAEYQFRRALDINPRSSLLHCFLGMVLHCEQQYDEALRTLAIAGALQPQNPQARFQRANVLMTLQRYEEAMEELEIVRNFAPRESSVHLLMGKIAKKLGRVDDATHHFTTALYFHPHDNNAIKAAIENPQSDVEGDEDV